MVRRARRRAALPPPFRLAARRPDAARTPHDRAVRLRPRAGVGSRRLLPPRAAGGAGVGRGRGRTRDRDARGRGSVRRSAGDTATLTKENVPPVAEIRTAADPDRQIVVTVSGAVGPAVRPAALRAHPRARAERPHRQLEVLDLDRARRPGGRCDRADRDPGAPRHRARRREAEERGHGQRNGGAHRRRRLGAALQPARHRLALRQGRTGQAPTSCSRAAPRRSSVSSRCSSTPIRRVGSRRRCAARRPSGSSIRATTSWCCSRSRPASPRSRSPPRGAPPVALAAAAAVGPARRRDALRPSSATPSIVSQQPGVESGMVVRELPLDLAAALPLALGAGEEVELRGARRRAQRSARAHRGGRQPRGVDRRRRRGRVSAVGDAGVARRPGRASHPGAFDQRHGRCSLRSAWWRGISSRRRRCPRSRPQRSPACRRFRASRRLRRRRSTSTPARRAPSSSRRTSRRSTASSRPACWRPPAPCARGRAPACSPQAAERRRPELRARRLSARGRLPAHRAAARRERRTSRARAGARADRGGGSLAEGIPARATIDPRRALAYRFDGRRGRALPGLRLGSASTLRHAARRCRRLAGRGAARPGRARRRARAGGVPADRPAAGGAGARDRPRGSRDGAGRALRTWSACARTRSRGREPLARAGRGRAARTGSLALHAAGGDRRDDHPLRRDDGLDPRPRGRRQRSRTPGWCRPGGASAASSRRGSTSSPAESSRSNNRLPYRVVVRTDDLVDGSVRELRAPGEITLAVGAAVAGRDRLVRSQRRARPPDERARRSDRRLGRPARRLELPAQ